MERCSLSLAPYGKPKISVALTSTENRQSNYERIIEQTDSQKSIYSDLSYIFTIEGSDISQIDGVTVYINDCEESCSYDNGVICFPGRSASDRRIFLDCYGFVEISIDFRMKDGTEILLRSEYLPVLVKRGHLNDSVKAMAQYVYSHQEDLLLNGDPKPRDMASLKEQGYQSLLSQVILAEEIAHIYEQSYGYFKANSRFKIEKTATVSNIERLQYITPATMQYMALHPEQLRQVNSTAGIRVHNKVYHPNKTLVIEDKQTHDIYENRVVVGFLRSIISAVDKLLMNATDLLSNIPSDDEHSGDYVFSSQFIFAQTSRMLHECSERLEATKKKLMVLWQLYSKVLDVKHLEVQYAPKPTAIFISVPQYNKIFVVISQRFTYGIYNFDKERFMLSFIKISMLYESYVLAKFISYLKRNGYALEESRKCHYPVPPRWKYKNTDCKNTFVFSDAGKKVTLYYQPVIFDYDSSQVNGLGLYRNNTISLSYDANEERRGRYYVPDYVIKTEINGRVRYIILDAKFSALSTVKKDYISALSFKYLFSVSTVTDNQSVDGLCIVYGQSYETNQMQSVYDKQIGGKEIAPFADMLPFMEGINDNKHDLWLRQLLAKIGI